MTHVAQTVVIHVDEPITSDGAQAEIRPAGAVAVEHADDIVLVLRVAPVLPSSSSSNVSSAASPARPIQQLLNPGVSALPAVARSSRQPVCLPVVGNAEHERHDGVHICASWHCGRGIGSSESR